MPFCPVCRYEYVPGIAQCADCGAALVDELPSRFSRVRAGAESDVVVARIHGQPIAQMWAELLGNHGIASRMCPLTGVVDTVYPTDTLFELLVAAADASRARAILPGRADRIGRQPSAPGEDELLDEVDCAIAEGRFDLADDLLSAIEDRGSESEPPDSH